jgi:hypothetical protein
MNDIELLSCEDMAVYYAVERGFSVIPVGENKKPLIEWKEYQSRIAGEDEIRLWWRRYPNANVAIITGAVSNLVAVDIDNSEAGKWAEDIFGATPVYNITSRGAHAMYRHPGGGLMVQNSQKFAGRPVDIRGDGGYIIAPPSRHASGFVYNWQFTPGFDGFNDLPVFNPSSVKDPSGLIDAALPIAVDAENGAVIDYESYIDVWRAVCPAFDYYFVNQAEQPEDAWFAFLSNIARSKDRPLEVAHAFSCKYPWYSRQETNDKFLRALSLYGPRTCQKIKPFGRCGDCPGHSAPINAYEKSPLLLEIEEHIAVETIQTSPIFPVPQEVLTPGGILQKIMDYIDKSAVKSYPLWNLGAALALLGTLGGQKVASGLGGARTNLYIMIVGNSGTGKTAGLNAIDYIFDRCFKQFKTGSDITSPTALLKSLASHNVKIMLKDEISDNILSMKNIRSYANGMLPLFKELLYKTSSVVQKDFSSKESMIIKYPHFSILGTTTPEKFWNTLSASDAEDGLLARFLILESDHLQTKERRRHTEEIPAELIESLDSISRMKQAEGEGNLDVRPHSIPFTPDAERRMNQIADDYVDMANLYTSSDVARAAVYRRVAENTEKIALIHALSLYGTDIKDIGAESVNYAFAFINYVAEVTINNMHKKLLHGNFDDLRKKFLNTVRKVRAADGWATARKIMQSVKESSKTFGLVMESLLQSGEVTVRTEKNSRGRPSVKYAIPLEIEEEK